MERPMARIIADRSACQGYANCVVAAGDYFDLDDDALVIVVREDVPDSERKRVEEAARSCPVSALVVED
jgi:ferredoxin